MGGTCRELEANGMRVNNYFVLERVAVVKAESSVKIGEPQETLKLFATRWCGPVSRSFYLGRGRLVVRS